MHYSVLAICAIILWGSLAVLATQLAHVPPFFLLAICFLLGGSLSLAKYRQWQFTPKLLITGIIGLFGYHLLLFMALRLAPPITANLLNYLWPLFIVMLAPLFLPKTRLLPQHLIGVLFGFAGAALIILQAQVSFSSDDIVGYVLAILAALTWACYSLVSKRFTNVSSANVGLYCLLSGVCAFVVHQLFEAPPHLVANDWLLMLMVGLGPMGMAFYCWDQALKKGDAHIIATLSYFTPLLSTGLLAFMNDTPLAAASIYALVLIVCGALICSLQLSTLTRLLQRN